MRSEFGPAQHRALANTRQTRVLCNHASDMSCVLNGTSMSGIMLTWGKWVATYSTQIDVFRLMEVPFTPALLVPSDRQINDRRWRDFFAPQRGQRHINRAAHQAALQCVAGHRPHVGDSLPAGTALY